MPQPNRSDKSPISIRLPKPETEGAQPVFRKPDTLFDEAGNVIPSRKALTLVFCDNPDALARLRPLFEPETSK